MVESYQVGKAIIAVAFTVISYLIFLAVLVFFFGNHEINLYRGFAFGGAVVLTWFSYSIIERFSKEVFEIKEN